MRPMWIVFMLIGYVYSQRASYYYAPTLEKLHDPERYTSTPYPFVFGTNIRVPYDYESPDFRYEEPLFLPYRQKGHLESDRPYRLTPHYKVTSRWVANEKMQSANCYCTTVYRRLTLLAGCAVITTRHILTTATSTHLILQNHLGAKHLENILGAWYDTNHNNYNSTMYATPARIHYHPKWHYPEHVNRSHPFSFTFDLAVWATTHNVYGWYLNFSSTTVCLRATSHWRDPGSPKPSSELFIIVGYQFMLAYRRRPMPWYKYGIRTRNSINPCPKNEWGWFICLFGNHLKYGIESGTVLHRTFRGESWRYDGLVGLGAFTMKLRSVELVHYFTILDSYPVLDFLFDSYKIRKFAVFKDTRFKHDTVYAPEAIAYYPNHNNVGVQTKFYPYYD